MEVDKFSQFANGTLTLRYFAFDWDDNILHMPTKILMDMKEGDNWTPTEVSTEEFAIKRHDTENYRIRNNDPKEAFVEFRDTGSRGGEAFIQDSIEAITKSKKAPAWNDFLQCLSEGAIFSIITARGHEKDSIRKGVEYIIDNVLTQTPSPFRGFSLADIMMQQLKKFKYYFDESSDGNEKFSGPPSQNPMVKEYLRHCDFFGVSSEGFANQFGVASAQNPEHAKIQAIEYCIGKCLSWAKELGEKLNVKVIVKFGFSDDDPKNMKSVLNYFSKYFSERKGLSKLLKLYAFYTGKDTTVEARNLTGGEKTSFKDDDDIEKKLKENLVLTFSDWALIETSNQAAGMESSTISMRDNMTKRLYPTTPERQANPYHHQLLNQIDMIGDFKKQITFGFKKPKKRKLK